ncbi:MAG: hypothetical protein C0467_12435 [Planctomycetaceae bacterium]|nr:hypothetical protein [Planctomycetaceae bacterium]
MAKDKKPPSTGDSNWDRTMRLFQTGSPEFVEAVRQRVNAVALAPFADTWYKDSRVEARKLLLTYLEQPLNAARHEPLVKRLFKFADNAGDDAVMARFLVGLDRTIRRKRGTTSRWDPRSRSYESIEIIYTPADTTLSRDDRFYLGSWFVQNREKFTQGKFLFSIPTRHYLRRRAWRYFRKLGKKHPDRYISGVCTALKLYTDADVPDGLGLLDNWGLVHILFHHSPALESRPVGWFVSESGTLPQLQPDPMYRKLWLRSPEPIFDLLVHGKCRPVCLWAAKMLRQHFPDRLSRVSLDELLDWLVSNNSVLNDLALEQLERAGGLESVPVEKWLKLMETARPDLLDRICEMVERAVKPVQVSFTDAVRLAMQRPVPLARLGMAFLTGKKPTTTAEVQALFGLREAQADPLRADLVRWACGVLTERPEFQPQWVLEFLDSRNEDVREIGWEWLQTDARAREDVGVWQRMLESPYDNIRLRLIGILEEQAKERTGLARFSPENVRFLWATVLLNITRGSKAKPFVVRQIMERVVTHPDEASELLPIIAVALRSSRGPEFRAGLAGVAAFVERNPARKGLVEAVFPELSWS